MRPAMLWFVQKVFHFLPPSRLFRFKVFFLRLCGIKVHARARICSNMIILGNGNLSIGIDSFIGHEVMLVSTAPSEIKIGDYVDIAPRAYLGTGTHEIDAKGLHVAGKGKSGSIQIGNGVWIGACAVILPGVVIGEKSIIAAGAVVNKNIPPYTVAAGVPARVVRCIENSKLTK